MIGQDSECKKCLLRPFGRSAKSSRVNFAKSLILHGWMQSWYPMRRNSRSALLALKKHQDRWDLKGCCDHPAVVSSRNLFLPIICSLAKIVQQRASFSCQLLKSWNIIRITIVIRNMCLRGRDLPVISRFGFYLATFWVLSFFPCSICLLIIKADYDFQLLQVTHVIQLIQNVTLFVLQVWNISTTTNRGEFIKVMLIDFVWALEKHGIGHL